MCVVFAEPARTPQPSEGAFDDPAAGQHLEAVERCGAFNHFETSTAAGAQAADPVDQRTGVAAVRPNAPQPAEAGEQQAGSIPILHVGGMDADEQNQSQGIDQKVSLSSCHLLASIVSTNSPLLSCSHPLRVKDRSRGGFFYQRGGARRRAARR